MAGRRKRTLGREELALWALVTRSVTPLASREPADEPPQAETPARMAAQLPPPHSAPPQEARLSVPPGPEVGASHPASFEAALADLGKVGEMDSAMSGGLPTGSPRRAAPKRARMPSRRKQPPQKSRSGRSPAQSPESDSARAGTEADSGSAGQGIAGALSASRRLFAQLLGLPLAPPPQAGKTHKRSRVAPPVPGDKPLADMPAFSKTSPDKAAPEHPLSAGSPARAEAVKARFEAIKAEQEKAKSAILKPVPPTPRQPAPQAHVPETAASRAGPGLERRLRLALRRGARPIEAMLDLHGMRQDEAHRALRRFLFASHQRGERMVLVITGKGAPVETAGFRLGDGHERGVLRRLVPQWLAQPDLRPLVSGCEEAGPRHGGGGALYVRLRR